MGKRQSSFETRGFKRILHITDTHCGHISGMSPPEYTFGPGAEFRAEMWGLTTALIDQLRPLDAIIFNGDLVDGMGCKHPAEHWSDEPNSQVLCAIEMCRAFIGADTDAHIAFVAGTDSHTHVKGVNLEELVAHHVGAILRRKLKYSNQEVLWVRNDQGKAIKKINYRHHIGNAQLNGVPVSLTKQALVNLLLNERDMIDKCDVFVRSHVHRYVHYNDATRDYIITPSLQGSTDFGGRRCDSVIDIGPSWIDITESGEVLCRKQLFRPKTLRSSHSCA